jgi:heat shock protein HtpX
MGAAFGLQTHIWNNNFKSVLLLAGFPLLLLLLMYGLFLTFVGLSGDWSGGAERPFLIAAGLMVQSWPFALIGAGVWFVIAYFGYQAMIDAATGARALSRQEAPEPYNLLENLCISRGVAMPSLRVIETDALNAFASGLHKGQYSITLTRGLISALDRQELEAVIAHELTHIQNRDVRLLVIAVIFVGIFSFVFEMLFRGFNQGGVRVGGRSSNSDSNGGGGGAAIAVIVGLVCIALAYALAIVIRFSLSRRREYLADAGAVELTKDPDALIRALRKISGHAEVESAPSEVREMFIENPHAGFGDMFATHPPIDKRIAALIAYAGGRDAVGVVKRKSPWG